MKTIGLLGGMSWESTVEYYRILNQEVGQRLGNLNCAKILMHSVNFQDFEPRLQVGDWDGIGQDLGAAAKGLANQGADMILICTNTMHRVADQVREMSGLPLVHIGEATANEAVRRSMTTVGLLGTKPTMELDFYRDKLAERGVQAIIPDAEDRETVHRIIFEELVTGVFREPSRIEYLRIMTDLQAQGAEGMVLGCTEIPLLVTEKHTDIPLLDTTALHAIAAVNLALK